MNDNSRLDLSDYPHPRLPILLVPDAIENYVDAEMRCIDMKVIGVRDPKMFHRFHDRLEKEDDYVRNPS